MKRDICIIAMAVIAFLCSCQDFVEGTNGSSNGSTKPHDAINFSLSTTKVDTRVAYGEYQDKSWSFLWQVNDKVKIYCPEASTTDDRVQQDTYTVKEVSADGLTATKFQSATANGLCWGEPDNHHFYQFYPADALIGNFSYSDSKATVTTEIPSVQEVKAVDPSASELHYTNESYMRFAGTKTVSRQSYNGETVALNVNHLFTTLDIVVDNPSDGSVFELEYITVGMSENAGNNLPLSGKFTYTIDTNQYANVQNSENYFVDIYPKDAGGNDQTITLKSDNPKTYRFTVFLRGDFNGEVKVVLHGTGSVGSAGGLVLPIEVSKHFDKDEKLGKGCYNHIKFDQFTDDNIKVANADWMKNIDDNTLLREMSLPGPYDSGNFIRSNGDNYLTQTTQMGKLLSKSSVSSGSVFDRSQGLKGQDVIDHFLNHGVRVLDLRLKTDASKSTPDPNAHFYINYGTGSYDANNSVRLPDLIEGATRWLKEHQTETLIMIMRPSTNGNSGNNSTTFNSSILSALKKYIEEFDASDYYTNYDSGIELGDARGKMLFMFFSSGINTTAVPLMGNAVNKNWVFDSNDDLQTLKWGTDGSGDAIYVHDKYNYNANTAGNRTDKKAKVLKSITEAKKKDGYWHITCNACWNPSFAAWAANEDCGNPYIITLADASTKTQPMGIVLIPKACTNNKTDVPTAENNASSATVNCKGQMTIEHIWFANYR